MAERRMFSSKVVCSDAFAGMPFSAQALYVQLCMEADDDGFLNRAKRIQGSIGASDADLNLLFEKRFVLGFENGVIAIKHWRMNNQIRKDRYTPTQYQDEFNSLVIRSDGAYTEKVNGKETVDELATTWQPSDNQNGNHLATQDSIDKYSIGKESIEQDIMPDSDESAPIPKEKKKPVKHKHGEFKNVLLTDNEFEALADSFGVQLRDKAIKFLDEYIEEKGYKSKSHNLAIRRWVMDAVSKEKPNSSQPNGTQQQQNQEFKNPFLQYIQQHS